MAVSDPYSQWAAAYPPHAHNALMEVEQAAVLSLLPPVSERRVLDAGCGTGRYTRLLGMLGARVIGVDLSKAMLSRAREMQLRVVRADTAFLPIVSSCCDLVVSGLAVMDVAELGPVLREWSRVLRHRGVLVYSTLHPRGGELGWKRTYDAGGRTHTMPTNWHTHRDHELACRAAGFAIERVDEPKLPAGDQPVALIVRARRHW
jgi:malonyl-CoA O-methyltransferase